MEPRIQYAQTEDGVSIAFWTIGEGEPLIITPPGGISHCQREWHVSALRSWYERLAQNRLVVRYDDRGTGLSDRSVANISLDTHVLDLEAVVARLGLERFALIGVLDSGLSAITYAARYPGKVSHLVLWCAYPRASDFFDSAESEADRALRDKDWNIYTETIARMSVGWSAGEDAHRLAELFREAVTQDMWRQIEDAFFQADMTPLLGRLEVPTLVMHRREFKWPGLEAAKALASQIREARLAIVEGESAMPSGGDADEVVRAIYHFLGESGQALTPEAGSMRTILFTDMEGSTDLTQRLGDAGAQDCLRTHNTIVRDALGAHGGSEIKHTGDGIMASFASASSSLEAAIAIQKAFANHNQDSAHTTIRVRIGLNAGEPVVEDDDLFGTAVQLAARVCAHAEPGQILTSNVVQELAAGKGFDFADKGEAELKGFEKPLRLYEVRWQE